MKTVCKKLLCLMLVAMMLVSAIPAAFATGDEAGDVVEEPIVVKVRVDKDGETINDKKSITIDPDETVYLDETLAKELINDWTDRVYVGWASTGSANATKISYGWAVENVTDDYRLIINLTAAGNQDPVDPDDGDDDNTQNPPEDNEPETNPTLYNLKFVSKYDETQYVTVEDGDEVDVPAGKDVYQKDFKGWYTGENGTGDRLRDGDVWEEGDAQTYYAYYVSGEGNVSKLRLYVQRYVDGDKHGDPILLLTEEFSNGENMKDWLNENKTSLIATKIFEVVDADEYEWINRYFYNYWGGEKMTDQTLSADGSKDIFVKVVSTDVNTSKVHLYLHKSEDADEFRILKMSGYSAGDYVTRAAVKDKIQDYYKYDSVSNLYTEDDWEELQDDLNNNGRSSVLVEDGDTTIIHVIVKNASSSSKADSTNPKTGDSIMIAVTTMTLAAVALVSMVELKKRKMI